MRDSLCGERVTGEGCRWKGFEVGNQTAGGCLVAESGGAEKGPDSNESAGSVTALLLPHMSLQTVNREAEMFRSIRQ